MLVFRSGVTQNNRTRYSIWLPPQPVLHSSVLILWSGGFSAVVDRADKECPWRNIVNKSFKTYMIPFHRICSAKLTCPLISRVLLNENKR
jgi:hypothetical protein